jgi:hypothetical protein
LTVARHLLLLLPWPTQDKAAFVVHKLTDSRCSCQPLPLLQVHSQRHQLPHL